MIEHIVPADVNEIIALISKPAGYVVEMCGLYVCRIKKDDSGMEFHVVSERPGDKWETKFSQASAAAAYFCRYRRKDKLGFDFEKKESIELPIISKPITKEEYAESYCG